MVPPNDTATDPSTNGLRLAGGVHFRRLLDEGIVLCFDAGEIVGMNDVGARIVELVEAGASSRTALARELAAEREVAAGVDVEADVDRFVGELVELGVLSESRREN